MSNALIVLLEDHVVGRVERDKKGALSFVYEATWRSDPDAYPLSLSMPLAQPKHSGIALEAYLWGLLPDNEVILDGWAKRFQVSARNPFALLANVGEDCPGAVRFVVPERIEAIAREGQGSIDWLTEHAVAERLRELDRDPAAWRNATDSGQFSLGGAQPKTALFFDEKRWGIPSGRLATTHILKPGSPELTGHAENEHFCLALASSLELPTATSRIVHFEDQVAVCVRRFDRTREGRRVRRVHQEDFCQALGVLPGDKYENSGGPGAEAVATVLRERSRDARADLATFIEALAFNWVIAGTDAHGKNYSALIGQGGAIRLAPLYDVASFLPYAPHGLRKLKLAMKIGGTYRLTEIGRYQWTKLAKALGQDPDSIRDKIVAMCLALPDLASDVSKECANEGLSHDVLTLLTREIQRRARVCAKSLR